MALSPPALVALTARGAALARRLQPALPGASVHGLARRVTDADLAFADAPAHLAALFAAGTPIVAICASGIVVRALAPLLADKRAEPPVVALAEDGSAAVPLLGGHRGANALARRVAAALGGVAAVTTAGDLALGLALDEPPPGWRIADPALVKPVAAALLAGGAVELAVESGDAAWLASLPRGAGPRIRVTHRVPVAGDALVFHPPVLALGVGCERGADPDAVVAFARAALAGVGLAEAAIACVASAAIKADEPAVHALAAALDVPARFLDADALAAEETRLATPSAYVKSVVGAAGVAEGAALAAAGADGALLVPKRVGPRATVAVALAAGEIDAARIGRPRGRLAVVGIGPGRADWRTPEAEAAIARAEDVVGYGLYLDLLGPALAGKRCHARALGEETERARLSLSLAAEGREVALVSSGDAGIYGLATLVFELLADAPNPAWRRVAVEVVPGVSALQAAAARAGAPLGHDFCVISLSDLLTPWPAIERRLVAAADADFAIALFNPASERRREPLARALAILRARREADTPVVLARNLGRAGENVTATTLAALDPDAIDMLTLVIVGASTTRRVGGFVYTPRGYAARREDSA